VLDTLRSQRPGLEAAAAAAWAAYEGAERHAKLVPGDANLATADAALQAARAAKQAVTNLEARLKTAERMASKEYGQAWAAIEASLKKRANAAAEIQRLAPALHAAYMTLKDCNAEICGLSVVEDWAGACCAPIDCVAMFKLELARVGFAWAAQTGFLQASDLPPLGDRIAAANQHAMAQRQ
jgi:hypothetical protein